jgi:predicted nucleic acid-binding protein
VTLICDTGVVYAALVRRDRLHEECAELLAARDDIVIPAPVVVEVDGLARSRRARRATDALLDSIVDRSVEIEHVMLSDYTRARELVTRYTDLRLGLVDAAIVAIAERLEQTVVATLDHRHFATVRPRHCEAFTLVP